MNARPWAVLAVALGAPSSATAQPLDEAAVTTPPSPSAPPVTLPPGARSVRVGRGEEVVRTAPDGAAARRGLAARSARLPILEARPGAGCDGLWVRVAPSAWLCGRADAFSTEEPAGGTHPAVPEGSRVPYRYASARVEGARCYQRLADARRGAPSSRLARGAWVAVVSTSHVAGVEYALTTAGDWVAAGDLAWGRPSERVGMRYRSGDAAGAVGFMRRRAYAWPTAQDALRNAALPAGPARLEERQAVHVRDEERLRGGVALRVDRGWVAAEHVLRPAVPAPPADLAAGERWVDVDRAQQLLVAFEGTRPVYAALVSTGRRATPTRPGEFRVGSAYATLDMANADAGASEGATRYMVARVPWVLFFHGSQALHGAFWHDDFGRPRSHGCVNLAPRDAAWLFAWAPPALPPGWTAWTALPGEGSLRVRVR